MVGTERPTAIAAASGSMISQIITFLSSGESMIRTLVKPIEPIKMQIMLLRTDLVSKYSFGDCFFNFGMLSFDIP
ncbi:MAG: hypothetical protein WAL79_07870 [Nitrososphaeraceae archaeon]